MKSCRCSCDALRVLAIDLQYAQVGPLQLPKFSCLQCAVVLQSENRAQPCMAQRLRGRVTQSATDADAERLTLPESNRVLSPQPQRPRLWEVANAGPNGDGKHTPDVTGRCSRCGSTPDDDDMDGSKGWHTAVKRGARASNWFNNIMGVLLLVLATFVFAVRASCCLFARRVVLRPNDPLSHPIFTCNAQLQHSLCEVRGRQMSARCKMGFLLTV